MGAAPPESDLLYFAFGNYTTLGYGDITPVDGWRLLGPMTRCDANDHEICLRDAVERDDVESTAIASNAALVRVLSMMAPFTGCG